MQGKELRDRRNALGMTAQELAPLLGVSVNTLFRWERDEVGFNSTLITATLESIERKHKRRKKPEK